MNLRFCSASVLAVLLTVPAAALAQTLPFAPLLDHEWTATVSYVGVSLPEEHSLLGFRVERGITSSMTLGVIGAGTAFDGARSVGNGLIGVSLSYIDTPFRSESGRASAFGLSVGATRYQPDEARTNLYGQIWAKVRIVGNSNRHLMLSGGPGVWQVWTPTTQSTTLDTAFSVQGKVDQMIVGVDFATDNATYRSESVFIISVGWIW